MISVRLPSSVMRKTILGFVLVCATILGGSIAPRTFASSSQAAVTESPVAFHLAAQLLAGPSAGAMVAGQVAGTINSTGLLTATLTLASGATSTVSGTAADTAQLAVKGKAGTMSLTGKLLNKMSGVWGGMVALGANTSAGSWALTPETQEVTFSIGGKSGMGSADTLALAGQLTLQLTADGWGDGTFAFLSNDTVLPAEGRVVNGNVTSTIFWSKSGALMLVASSKHAVGITKYTGTFAGPAVGDFGTFIGEG